MDWQSEEHQRILAEYNANHGRTHEDFLEAMEKYTAEVKLLLERDLSNQVRDFIEWLQEQGIIN